MYFASKFLVYPVKKEARIILEPQGPVSLDGKYELKLEAFSGLRRYKHSFDEKLAVPFMQNNPLLVSAGTLTMSVIFPQEDRYLCTLLLNGEKLEQFEVCALEDDLFVLNPYKGDNHMHSCYSDGKESPAYMAAACCRRGYDYCVLTDHYDYEPSLIGKRAIDALGVDFTVLPGEEIHATGNNVHIINMGGSKGVNAWYKNEPEDYDATVRAEMAKIEEDLSEKDKWAIASSQCVFDKIHDCGGVAILCHPLWVLQGKLQETQDITDYLFDHKRFDVYELIAGGAFEEGTQLQISYYHDLPTMPIVGSSDTHQQFGGRLEPGNFTVVFAPSASEEDIKESVRMGRATAGYANKFFGDYRLLRYTYFLAANIFPRHDELCATRGMRMIRYASSGCDPESTYANEVRASVSPMSYFLSKRYTEE